MQTTTRLTRIAIALGTAVIVVSLGGAARASEASPSPAPTPSPVPTPTATATPAPTPTREPTPQPTAPQATQPRIDPIPTITPWPWPAPWMNEMATPTPAPPPAAATGSTDPASPQEPDTADLAPGDHALAPAASVGGGPRPRGSGPVSGPDGEQTTVSGEQDVPEGQSDDQPAPPRPGGQTPALPVGATESLQRAPTASSAGCDSKALENGVTGDGGAILQVAVQGEDCHWSAAQVLVGYDIRGPPTVEVLTQSTGLSIDVEAFVTEQTMSLRFGYVGSDGVQRSAAPTFTAPMAADASGTGSAGGPLGAAAAGAASASGSQAQQTGDNRIRVVQEVDTVTGDAVSGSQRVAVIVDGDATAVRILAQNGAAGAAALSGDAVSVNHVDAVAGPVAAGSQSGSQAGQIGNNVLGVDQDARARSGDAIAGTQEVHVRVTGSAGEIGVLAQNSADGAVAMSGDAVAINDATAVAGPVATSGAGSAQAQQTGNNHVDLNQNASAQSGDAHAGSQVIRITVGGSVGHLAVLGANSANGALARSGDAVAVNSADVGAGPQAVGAGSAFAAQTGSNVVRIGQSASAATGTASAGSQLIFIEVGGVVGDGAVLPQNSAAGTVAVSGNASAVNLAGGSAGPQAVGSQSAAQQQGSNDVGIDQGVGSTSGDAVSGGQVTGVGTGLAPVPARAAADPSGIVPARLIAVAA